MGAWAPQGPCGPCSVQPLPREPSAPTSHGPQPDPVGVMLCSPWYPVRPLGLLSSSRALPLCPPLPFSAPSAPRTWCTLSQEALGPHPSGHLAGCEGLGWPCRVAPRQPPSLGDAPLRMWQGRDTGVLESASPGFRPQLGRLLAVCDLGEVTALP